MVMLRSCLEASICRVGCAHRTRLRSPSNGGRSPPYEHYWFMGSIRDRCSVVGSTHEPAAGGRTDFPSPTGRRRSEGPGEGETARFMGTIRGRNAARRSTHEPAAGGRTDFPSPTGRRRSEGPGEGETARFMGTIRGRNVARRSLPEKLSTRKAKSGHGRVLKNEFFITLLSDGRVVSATNPRPSSDTFRR